MGRRKSTIDAYVERHFTTNEHGIWCPNCDEQIDYSWPESCDHCGYPKPGYERFDEGDGFEWNDEQDGANG